MQRPQPWPQEQWPVLDVPGLLGAHIPPIVKYSGSPDENLDDFRDQIMRYAYLLGYCLVNKP